MNNFDNIFNEAKLKPAGKSRRMFIQPKLTINEPGDQYEKEADTVADHIMTMNDAFIQPKFISNIQRKCAHCEEEENKMQRKEINEEKAETHNGVENYIGNLNGSGQPMPEEVRSFYEPRFGYDFSNVKVHTDDVAAKSAQSINALAYTTGNNIVFNENQYSPGTEKGKKLLAHELTHVVQQGTNAVSCKKIQRRPFGSGDPIHDPILDQFSAETGIPRHEASQHSPAYEAWLYHATHLGVEFIQPTPIPQNPLTRLGRGDPPGLTTPTINNTVIRNHQDVLTEITPTTAEQSGTSGGNVACRFPRNFQINTSAQMIVAENPGPNGWTSVIPTATFGNPQACAGRGTVPTTMTAQPGNNDFVRRVRESEQEHANAINRLHERHLVPYHRFLMSLSGQGNNLGACGQNLVAQLNNRNVQAAYAFALGYQAETASLDSPGGTHADTAVPAIGPNCASATIVLSQTNPRIAGSSPGNIVPIVPTQLAFNPSALSVSGNAIVEGATTIKTLSNNAEAQEALRVIRHYGINSRHTIGSFEYFLVNGNAPSGPLAGAQEFSINPDNYQVSVNIPNPNDWTITDVASTGAGVNVNVIWNFGAQRDQAYSAVNEMRRNRFTFRSWVGGTRQSPSMLYFRN